MDHKVLRPSDNVFIFKQFIVYGSLSNDARCVKILLAIHGKRYFSRKIFMKMLPAVLT